MDRVFLDANVLFSAAYRASSGLVALWRLPTAQLLTSAYALSEAERNLMRQDQRRRLTALVRSCEIVPTPSRASLPSHVSLPDNDQPILLAAMAAEATHLSVIQTMGDPFRPLRHMPRYALRTRSLPRSSSLRPSSTTRPVCST